MALIRYLASLVGCAVSLSAGHALADVKFELGARTGYGIPLGDAAGGSGGKLKELVVGQVPLWFDLGARVDGHVFIGGYFSYGFGFLPDDAATACDQDDSMASAFGGSVSCSIHDTRLGVEGAYHLALPGTGPDFWFGGGLGYEWVGFTESISVQGQSADLSIEVRGWEFLNLQTGVDFALSEHAALGPFLALTIAQYDQGGLDCAGACSPDFSSISGDVSNKALHDWLFIGVRGTFPL